MPQVLPYVPSFAERLSPVLSQAVGNVAQGFAQRSNKRAWEKFISPEAAKVAPGQENPAGISDGLNQMQQQAPAQPGPSPLERILNKPGGPSLGEFQAAVNLAENANPGSGKVVADFLTNKMKSGEKEANQIRKEERDLLSPGNKSFFEQIAKDRESLSEKQIASESIINAINSGETGVLSKANIGSFLTNLGAPEEVRKALETPGSKEFKSASKTFLASNMRDAFRGNTTGREINIAEQIGAELGVNENANLAAALFQQVKVNLASERIQLTQDLLDQGVSASKVPAIVDKKMKSIADQERKDYFQAVQKLGFK